MPLIYTLPSPTAPLTEHDLPGILDKLCPHSFKWKEIAQGLGFVPSELSMFEAHPPNAHPSSYLRAMLSSWQQWAPGDARGSTNYATLEALKTAVDKAGLGRTAQELQY